MSLSQEGARLLTSRYYGDGRWSVARYASVQDKATWDRDWTVSKYRPRKPAWARSSHASASKVHAIRYTLTGKHRSGLEVYLTVWWCGTHARTKIRRQSHPIVVCAACHDRLSGRREVVMGEGWQG